MSYSVVFAAGDAYAEIRVSGEPSLQQRDRTIDDLLGRPGFGPATPILMDGRQVQVLPDRNALIAFADNQARKLPGHPIAYLMNPGVGYGVAREISTYMQLQGLEAQVFLDEAEAKRWLLNQHG